LEEELGKDVCHRFYGIYTANTVPRKLLKSFGDFKMRGQVIHPVKFADDIVRLPKEEATLQAMIERLIEIGKCNGMEINVEKSKVMRISRQP
jgi:hypothetical protein